MRKDEVQRQVALRTGSTGTSRVLTIVEAAVYLNVSVRFMRRLVDERRIAFVKVGKFVRFERDDLERFLRAGRVEASRVA